MSLQMVSGNSSDHEPGSWLQWEHGPRQDPRRCSGPWLSPWSQVGVQGIQISMVPGSSMAHGYQCDFRSWTFVWSKNINTRALVSILTPASSVHKQTEMMELHSKCEEILESLLHDAEPSEILHPCTVENSF